MVDDTSPTWWYEDGGRQAGPVTAAALQRLLAEGRVSPAHRVWKNGMAAWEPMSRVAELAPVLQGAAGRGALPPPLALPPPFSPQPAGFPGQGLPAPGPLPASTVEPGTFQDIPVGLTVFLAVITFGIYGLVKYWQTAKGYERLAGRASRFDLWFWLFVGLGVAGVLVNGATGILGVPLGIASAVFQVLSLVEALQLRDEAMDRNDFRVPVTSASTHKVLLVLGIVLSVVVVGLVLFLVQAVKWFSDWNEVAAAARAAGRG